MKKVRLKMSNKQEYIDDLFFKEYRNNGLRHIDTSDANHEKAEVVE